MQKLIHIHTDIKFVDHSRRYLHDQIVNEIVFIGSESEDVISKLDRNGIKYKICQESKSEVEFIIKYANKFDGVIFNSLTRVSINILLNLNFDGKTFLKFFGHELYALKAENYLSDADKSHGNNSDLSESIGFFSKLRRKIRIALNKEYFVQSDNQRKVYEKLDFVLMISKQEYDELSKLFYLPELIERQLIDQEQDIDDCESFSNKSNEIIIGNSAHRWNNHLDILNIIKGSDNRFNVKYNLFFSYGMENIYAQEVREVTKQIENTCLIENFLSKDEFENIYKNASALVINSYRQHAIGNIIAAVKYGCKIYLSEKSSTYHWLKSKGFLIHEVGELKSDIEAGNIKLSKEDQERNINSLIRSVKEYSVEDFLRNIITKLTN